MTVRKLFGLVAAGVISLAFAASTASADEVIIEIRGPGSSAQYVQKGQTTQFNVEVFVGDVVTWDNKGTSTHTATSDFTYQGERLFDTEGISSGATKTVKFDQ